ncbi:MAG: DUF6923 family protein [Bryobacteraceae bacterium]
MTSTYARAITCLALTIVVPLASGGPAQAAPLFGATGTGGGTGTLVSIDPTTGVATAIGPTNDALGQNYRLTGLAFDSATGVLYGSANRTSPTNPASLVTVDPLTGLVTLVGSYGQAGETMADLTFNPGGTLYGWLEPDGDDLYSIDPSTGVATLIGDSGLGTFGSGLAADGSGVLFLAGTGTGGFLHTIDAGTGAATLGAALDAGPAGGGSSVSALEFSPEGVLFGVVGQSGGLAPSYLVTINTQTGAITSIGQSIDRLDAIAFQPDLVPEPGTLGLLAVGCLAGWVLRRRRTA